MRSGAALACLALLALCACSPGAPKGVSKERLDQAVSDAIGDPATCLEMADRGSGRIVYRYNTATVCARVLASCEGAGRRTIGDLLQATAKDGKPREESCNTAPDGSRGVSWASGVIPGKDLAWAAVMEGARTFPGRMMTERLEPRFKDAGL